MSSLNRVSLIGNVGADPEVKSMPTGDKLVTLSVATSEQWKNKSGEKQVKTQWHKIVVWNQGIAGVIEKYVKKGDKIFIEGQLETRKYEKDGVDVYTTEVVVRPFGGQLVLLGGKSGGGEQVDAVAAGPVAADIEEITIPF